MRINARYASFAKRKAVRENKIQCRRFSFLHRKIVISESRKMSTRKEVRALSCEFLKPSPHEASNEST